MANVLFRVGSASEYSSLASKDQLTFYYLQDSQRLYLGEVEITSAAALADVVADVAQNAADIADIQAVLATIQGDDSVSGSMRNLIKLASNTLMAEINKKTTQEIVTANGKSLVWNEASGGGAKFEHADGTWSFVGVNDGGENGLAGQLYVVKKNDETNKYEGTRLNLTKGGFYYVKGDSAAYTAGDELATLKDVQSASGDAATKTIYMVDASSGQSEYAKVWHFYQGSDSSDMSNNRLIGTLNFPLDKVLRASSIITLTYSEGHLYDNGTDVTSLVKGDSPATAADAGKYMKFEMQNVDDPMYANLTEFIDIYTTNNQTAEITLSIDGNNNITGTIGNVAASKIIFEVAGGTSTTVQAEIEEIKEDVSDIQTNLTWQAIE